MATINLTNCENIRIDICYHQILNFPGEKILFHNEIERENHIARFTRFDDICIYFNFELPPPPPLLYPHPKSSFSVERREWRRH